MRHTHLRARNAGKQFNADKNEHPPLGIQRDGRENERKAGLRIQHGKAHQHAVNGTGSAQDARNAVVDALGVDSGILADEMPDLEEFHAGMQQHRTEAGDEVEPDELPGAQGPFHHHAEHHQRVHVEEDVHEAVVHEHVGEGLPPAELRAQGESHGKGVLHERGVNEGCHEHNHVHIQEVAGYNRDIFKGVVSSC